MLVFIREKNTHTHTLTYTQHVPNWLQINPGRAGSAGSLQHSGRPARDITVGLGWKITPQQQQKKGQEDKTRWSSVGLRDQPLNMCWLNSSNCLPLPLQIRSWFMMTVFVRLCALPLCGIFCVCAWNCWNFCVDRVRQSSSGPCVTSC